MSKATLPPRSARPASGFSAALRRLSLKGTVAAIVGVVCVYYGLGAFLYHRIDADPDFAPSAPVAGGSHAIEMVAALIEREVVLHAWQPNDPWFMPNGMLDNAPNFQSGIQGAIARFSFELVDQVGRTRGSSRADPDLERAAGLLQFPGDVWFFDFRKSFLPTITSESQYRAARAALLAYNGRLAQNGAVFDRRTDSLAATINRVAADLGSQSALVDEHLRNSSGWVFNLEADDLFYATKGRLYAYSLLLRELGRDFQVIIEQNNLQAVLAQTTSSLREASNLQPWVVLDGSPTGAVFANHLAAQGFHLKRALVQLNEMSQVLVN